MVEFTVWNRRTGDRNFHTRLMGYSGEQKREYQRQWMAKRRQSWIDENGPCVKCGSFDNLEVDHIDPNLKTMQPALIWSRKESDRLAELSKCQVLCHKCHKEKTKVFLTKTPEHGTYTMRNKYGCKCFYCKEYVRESKRKSRIKLRQ